MGTRRTTPGTSRIDRNNASQQAHDLAAYLVSALGPTPVGTLKLQKLMYYCQGWKLAITSEPIVPDRIEAWKHGPVFPAIYRYHSRRAAVESWEWGDGTNLSGLDRKIANAVLRTYGDKTGWALREMTHKEEPWRRAWRRSQQNQSRAEEIPEAAIGEYFETLQHGASLRARRHNAPRLRKAAL